MTDFPEWLPSMFQVNPWTHDTYDRLYAIFKRDFKDTQLNYEGHAIWFFPDFDSGKEVIFWHLTSRTDDKTGERLPDFRRSERLPWARPILDNYKKPEILAWDYIEGNLKIHTYVWLKDYDYLIIMKKYKDGTRRLITSYYVDYNHKKKKLLKKYNKKIE
jgi:hypothetical protein